MVGKVKWFDDRKGFGFIMGSDNKDYFIYQSNILMEGYRKLDQDQAVKFEICQQADGRVRAVDVEVIVG